MISNTPLFEVKDARTGIPTVSVGGAHLHSAYDPVREAADAARRFDPKPGRPVIVLGFGLGYHVEALLSLLSERGDPHPEVLVYEWNPEMLRMAREVRGADGLISRVRLREVTSPEDLDGDTALVNAFDRRAEVFALPGLAKARPETHHRLWERLNRVRLRRRLARVRFRILVVSPIYGGSLSTSRYVAEAFRSLGHVVEFMDFSPYQHALSQADDVTSDPGYRNHLQNSLCRHLSELCVARCSDWKPDLVFALAQAPLSPEAFRAMREMKIPTAFWFVEDFRLFPYWKTVAPACDYFFTIQKGAFFDELRTVTSNRFEYLPQACAPRVHRPLDLSPEERQRYASDVSFVGAGYHNRQKFLLGLMHHGLKVWGTGWDLSSVLSRHLQEGGRWIETEEVVKIYNGSKINLNLHSSTYHEGVNPNGDFVNPRTFEIAAIGAFQLVDRRTLLGEAFEEDREVITFSDLRDVEAKVGHFLAHDEDRGAVAQAARRRALRDHTFERRLETALDWILEWDYPRFAARLEAQTPVEKLLEGAAGDAELTALLRKYEERGEVGFQDIVRDIRDKSGALDDTEMIFLLLDQLWQERVAPRSGPA